MAEKIYMYSPPIATGPTVMSQISPIGKSAVVGSAKEIFMDKGKIQAEICTKVMIGLAQLKEGKKEIKKLKDNITPEIWTSNSSETYKNFIDEYVSYLEVIIEFFEELSKKIIDNAETFEEMDKLMSKQLNFESWR
ncbi:hypothetical protein ACN6J9_00090 [Carnobacterium maltaromaticum]|uniref:hypothetical protein n=1 Tax=Carnobacterium maltaromaticum TaxID=2751 RepID=UPI000704E2B8|nr:hypothetical protein [Carnobacterium maltaromaticum]KRN73899.1 hypothetical protein IV76_GL000018 [Carnobacterium maltaromaticum]MBC9810674.1 hypothetical protein [Carnobacterium maltaromaticum]CRH18379.1 hypothetical protein CM318V1_220018 [Carnobacterium maltaromaticum]CRH22426.1 hypothetical protein BN1423_340019 [Carnobacterium maltaromaticum]